MISKRALLRLTLLRVTWHGKFSYRSAKNSYKNYVIRGGKMAPLKEYHSNLYQFARTPSFFPVNTEINIFYHCHNPFIIKYTFILLIEYGLITKILSSADVMPSYFFFNRRIWYVLDLDFINIYSYLFGTIS